MDCFLMYISTIFGVEDYFGIGHWHGSSNLFWLLMHVLWWRMHGMCSMKHDNKLS